MGRKTYSKTIKILVFINFCTFFTSIFSFVYTTKKVSKIISNGPESGWIFLFVGVPLYRTFLILLALTIIIFISTIIYCLIILIKIKKNGNNVH